MEPRTKACGPYPGGLILTHTHVSLSDLTANQPNWTFDSLVSYGPNPALLWMFVCQRVVLGIEQLHGGGERKS